MTGSSGAIDLTNGEILPKLVALAWPSVLQAVLSNCYAFNDFVFAGHIRDPKQASAATAALSATVGLQVWFSLFDVCCQKIASIELF